MRSFNAAEGTAACEADSEDARQIREDSPESTQNGLSEKQDFGGVVCLCDSCELCV